jgi:hypothetical protein
VAEKVAAAFAHTFWWSVVTILIAFVPTLFLPSRQTQATQNAALDADDALPAPAALSAME